MADAKLKLSIITALDNAGIKATKEQVGQLENSLKNVNKTSGNTGSALAGTFKNAMTYIKGAAGGLALFWAAGPKLFKFFDNVQSSSSGMAEGVKNAFSNMAQSISDATLEHFGVFKELDNAVDTFKKGLDLQLNGVDKLVAGTAKLQDGLTNDLQLFEHIAGVVNKVEDSMDRINVHANSLQQSAFNDYLEDVGATQEEKNIANALFKVDDAAEKQRQAVQTRNRKLEMIDSQIDKAYADAEAQAELVDKLERKVKGVRLAEEHVVKNGQISDVSFEDYMAASGNIFSFLGGIGEWYMENKEHKQYKQIVDAAINQRKAIEERLSKAREALDKKTTAIDKLEASRVGIDAETSTAVANASNDVRYMVSRYDRLARIQDPTQMAGVDWRYNEGVIGSALEKVDFDIPNKHLEKIEENTKELSDLKNYLQELLSVK